MGNVQARGSRFTVRLLRPQRKTEHGDDPYCREYDNDRDKGTARLARVEVVWVLGHRAPHILVLIHRPAKSQKTGVETIAFVMTTTGMFSY